MCIRYPSRIGRVHGETNLRRRIYRSGNNKLHGTDITLVGRDASYEPLLLLASISRMASLPYHAIEKRNV